MTYLIQNILPILAGTAIYMAVGFLWYMPQLFGTVWQELQFGRKRSKDELRKGMGRAIAGSLIMTLITACTMRKLYLIMGVATPAEGMRYGLWLGIAFVAATMLTDVLYAQKPVKLYAINAGYHVVSLVLMGALYGWWI